MHVKSMNQRFVIIIILLMAPVYFASGQHSYPRDYFRSPVTFPITLAGSFGEIRRNHFHSGIDIRTEGVQGKPVYAIADGYVSRVNVSPGGFGKALYIIHPNGFLSLYGHLNRYAGAIAAYVKAQQYRQESFAIDIEVPQGALKVKKGDLIAYSGNSGASGGPHLHFEIRDARTQEIIDPLDFGFMNPSGISPDINWLKIYPYDENSLVNNSANPALIQVAGAGGSHSLKLADTIRVSGNVIFGIETFAIALGGMKTGVHNITLSVDGVNVFSQNIDRFAFAETRYVNSLMDYASFLKTGKKIQRSYVAPNNKLNVYSELKNRGVVSFTDSKKHRIRYLVKDAFGKSSELNFWVVNYPPPARQVHPKPGSANLKLMSYKTDNQFEQPGVKLDLPKDALYDDLAFEYSVSAPVRGSYAGVHHLHNEYTPVHSFCTLSIKTDNLPKNLTSKAVIVSVGTGSSFSSRGGTWENGWITTKIRDFGDYTVTVDTDPPVIRPVNITPNKNIKKQSSILVKISDNLAGIKSYRGTLNGKWILMDFDEKNHLLTYLFDEMLKPGKNTFVLRVTDAVGNSAHYEAVLIR